MGWKIRVGDRYQIPRFLFLSSSSAGYVCNLIALCVVFCGLSFLLHILLGIVCLAGDPRMRTDGEGSSGRPLSSANLVVVDGTRESWLSGDRPGAANG